MTEENYEKHIEDATAGVLSMIEKATNSQDANDCMKFSQSALNSANALAVFASMDDNYMQERMDKLERSINEIASHLVFDIAKNAL